MRLAVEVGAVVIVTLVVVSGFSEGASSGTGFVERRGAAQWRGDFETGNLSQWVTTQAKDPSRVIVQSDVRRQGRYASRFEVRPGDDNVAGSGSGERAEVYVGDAAIDAREGREQWWAWSTLWDKSFEASSRARMWNYFTQFHNTGTSGQASVAWNSPPDNTVRLRVCNGGNPDTPRCRYFTMDSRRRNGRWYDFVFHVKWSSDPSVGFVEMWEDGRRVVPFTRIATLYPGQGVYLKQGYYRSAHAKTAIVYHDGMRRGASYEDVVAEFPAGSPAARLNGLGRH